MVTDTNAIATTASGDASSVTRRSGVFANRIVDRPDSRGQLGDPGPELEHLVHRLVVGPALRPVKVRTDALGKKSRRPAGKEDEKAGADSSTE